MPLSIPPRLRLPLSFDQTDLRADLDAVPHNHWIDHFNNDDYEGHWSVAPLRGPSDAEHPIQQAVAHGGVNEWADTALVDDCPHFAAVLEALRCPKKSVRLMKLGAGAHIREHTDPGFNPADEVRLHIPIQTDDGVRFVHDGHPLHLSPGNTFYLDFSQPHAVRNESDVDRVHLVADCIVNDWLQDLLSRGTPMDETTASDGGWFSWVMPS